MKTYGVSIYGEYRETSSTLLGAKQYATRHGFNAVFVRFNMGYFTDLVAFRSSVGWHDASTEVLPHGASFDYWHDTRYRIHAAYCGNGCIEYLVNFCGEYIGTGALVSDATGIAHEHKEAREYKLAPNMAREEAEA